MAIIFLGEASLGYIRSKDVFSSSSPLYEIELLCNRHMNIDIASAYVIGSDPSYFENPYVIELGPGAFLSEVELANTIAHELNHARSFIKGGNAPERTAYRSGNTLAKYIRGGI